MTSVQQRQVLQLATAGGLLLLVLVLLVGCKNHGSSGSSCVDCHDPPGSDADVGIEDIHPCRIGHLCADSRTRRRANARRPHGGCL